MLNLNCSNLIFFFFFFAVCTFFPSKFEMKTFFFFCLFLLIEAVGVFEPCFLHLHHVFIQHLKVTIGALAYLAVSFIVNTSYLAYCDATKR